MSSQMSIQFTPELSVAGMREHMRDALIRGQNIGVMAASGTGKTTTVVELAETLTSADMAGHPLECDGVVVQVLNMAEYDEISVRGVLVAGDTYADPYSGRHRVASDMAAPPWFTDCTQKLTDNPTKHLIILIDEINLGIPSAQAVLLSLLDFCRVGGNAFSEADANRISFVVCGNRPEDLPASNYLTGPLCLRIDKWFRLSPTAQDVMDYLGSRGELAPEVEKFLTEYPHLVCLAGVTATGQVPGLNDAHDESDSEDTGYLQPVANGLNPRKWHMVSQELQWARLHHPEAKRRQLVEALGGMCPAPVANQLVANAQLADTFATMDDVVRDPETAEIPTSPLLQSMQVRMLLPALSEKNHKPFTAYVKRMPESAASIVVAFVVAQGSSQKSEKPSMRGGKRKVFDIPKTVTSELIKAFFQEYSNAMARAHGAVLRTDAAPVADQRTLAMPAATPTTPPTAPPTIPTANFTDEPLF